MPKRDFETDEGTVDSDSLCTPPEIFTRMYDLFDGIPDCDPCTNDHALVRARKRHLSLGLVLPWGEKTYENHPYSTNEPWIDKAIYEMKIGRVRELLILCMVASSTEWWQKAMIRPRRNPRVICTKRLKFYGPTGQPMKHTARFDTALIYYGTKVKKFDRLYASLARWTAWGR